MMCKMVGTKFRCEFICRFSHSLISITGKLEAGALIAVVKRNGWWKERIKNNSPKYTKTHPIQFFKPSPKMQVSHYTALAKMKLILQRKVCVLEDKTGAGPKPKPSALIFAYNVVKYTIDKSCWRNGPANHEIAST